MIRNPTLANRRLARRILTVTPRYSMVSPEGLVHLDGVMRLANDRNIPGAVVECGSWNGGSVAMMGATCADQSCQTPREFWAFDSFEGLPPPGDKDGKEEQEAFFVGWCLGDPEKVRRIFAQLSRSKYRLNIVRGWFSETMNETPVDQIALLHVDVDWFESVEYVLETLYDKIAPGGFIVFDDYGVWQGCRTAVDQFLDRRRVSRDSLRPLTRHSSLFQKPMEQQSADNSSTFPVTELAETETVESAALRS